MNNVIGKILIVLQLVFSLCFMCFAGAVYSFQAGWKTRTVAAEQKLNDANANLKTEQDQNNQEVEALKTIVTAETERANGAQANLAQLNTSLQQINGQFAQAQQERDKFQADLLVAQQEAQARMLETIELRAETKRLRDEQNDAIALRRTLEDDKLDLAGQLAIAEEQKVNALRKVLTLQDRIRLNGDDPDEPLVGPVPAAITRVDGVVVGSKKNQSRSAELVEISVGTDDGITKGMRLVLYRDSDFIGEIVITSVYPDSAVGRVVEDTRNGTIERGDNVTTKL